MISHCLSGGAIGSDLVWGNTAREVGHKVVHFSFEKHRTSALASERLVLSEKQLLAADPYITQAIIKLKRAPLHKRTHNVQSLLRRNWWQVRDAEACYAVSHINDKGAVAGGTGYAVQMFIDRGLMTANAGPWVYDQEVGTWLRWDRSWAMWRAIDKPPRPEGRYAGIGTRDINALGIEAIEAAYD